MSTNPKAPGLWTMPKGEFEKSVQRLEAAIMKRGGNPVSIFERFRTDQPFTDRLAEFALRSGIELSIESKLAQSILGRNNVFTETDWISLYGANFTKKQLRDAGKFPWGEDVLNSTCPLLCKKTVRECHFAHLGIDKLNGQPLTILKWHELHPATGQPRFYFDGSRSTWYQGQDFAEKFVLNFRWYLTHKEIVPGSTSTAYTNQVAMLPPEYEVPTAIEEVQKDILVFRKTGVWPNSKVYARTKDVASGGGCVDVGDGDGDGLRVSNGDDGGGYCIGLGASRKLPS